MAKEEYFLNIAKSVALGSKCKRRKVGAIIVKGDRVVSMGYNGPARKAPNCPEYGCLKDKHDAKEGQRYDLCRAGPLHAEVNAIINAAREGTSTVEGIMFIYGISMKDNLIAASAPCIICQKLIINAGIKEVIIKTNEGFERYNVENWIKEAYETENKDIKGFY